MSKGKRLQLTDTIVMIRPDQFGFNPETAESNFFQNKPQGENEQHVRDNAVSEFHAMADELRRHGINILILPTRSGVITPDAIYPNNWFSHHQEGVLVLYPMRNTNRTNERQIDNLVHILETAHIVCPHIYDMTGHETLRTNIIVEENGQKKKKSACIEAFEGTGSVVLDRIHKVAFAMESVRTTREVFDEWCAHMGYTGVWFHAYDKDNFNIYHTNVVLSIGDGFAVACPESVKNPQERAMFEAKLQEYGRELISVTLDQVSKFCANILQVQSARGEPKIVMSEGAFNAYSSDQKGRLKKYGEFIVVKIPTIENVGGGSARCMMAEVFPPI